MKKLILVCFVIGFTNLINAQLRSITGIVSDEMGPIADISVTVKGTKRGTVTDFDGKYTIQAKTGDVLVFSHISYSTVTRVVKKSNTINVFIPTSGYSLQEVVVCAMGTRRRLFKRSKPERSSTKQMLSNALIQNTNNATMHRKGIASTTQNKQPMYILNGVMVTEKEIKKIPSKKIKSLNVLKRGRGMALYGSQAVNGIVVVETKKKSAKEKMLAKQLQQRIISLDDDESYASIPENNFKNVQSSPLSTFSIDVDKASYSNIRRFLNNGQKVPADAVKIEEMINYFTYNYQQPKGNDPFAIYTEVTNSPWNKGLEVVKIGLQGKKIENTDLPASNLVFLIDVSGSMSSYNKLPLLKSAFKILVNQLRKKDKISIVVYAGAAGVVLESTSGDNKEKIIEALDRLEAGGSTAGGEGIELAYKIAEKNFIKKGNNRIILATDGDFNVGASSDKAMEKLIEEKRKSGVFLTCLGFGMGNYKDSKLETLADKGNGNHAYIDTYQEAKKVLGTEFGGTIYTIAKDVKIQVEFNPNKVQAYRLIGYENRLLADEDFVDDTKDAGELGSNHTVTALYEVIPKGIKSTYLKDIPKLKYTKNTNSTDFGNELLTVKFRYKKPDGNKSKEIIHVVKNEVKELNNASEDMRFALAVASFGLKLRKSQYLNNFAFNDIIKLANNAVTNDKDGYKKEFIRLVKMAKEMDVL